MLTVTHPQVVEFQNNLLSWVGPEWSEFLNKNLYDFEGLVG
jgi:hypothetical protein